MLVCNVYICQNIFQILTMKKTLFTLIFVFYVVLNSNAQYSVKIHTSKGNDTIKTCSDSTITFVAIALNGIDTVKTGLTYTWDFDDGESYSQLNLDTVNHTFTITKLYKIIVTAQNGTFWANDIIIVELGLDPLFSDSKTDIPKDNKGICNGETVVLTGSANSNLWKDKKIASRTEIFPQYIDDAHSYSSYITRKDFDDGQKITASNNFDSIGIKIEHSDASNLKITLTCPNGQSAILKNSGGVQKALGEPITAVGDFSEGLGYYYYWTNTPTFGTMNTYPGTQDTLPAGTYTADQNFTNFIGCPINGNWTISVEDLSADANDGYAFSWSLFFNPSIENPIIQYNNTYNLSGSFWSGDNVNLTSNGIGDAIPNGFGNHSYRFYVSDNWGCMHDTVLNVLVEQAIFDADKQSMVIGDSVQVEDKTSWTDSRTWDFGDQSSLAFDKSEYKKYTEKGIYLIKMTAKSLSGCTDIDTAQITVIPRPITIDGYNIFSPNGDGINDVFSFFNTLDEKITAANIEKISGRIYNRFGEIVCKWETQEEVINGWDGTIKNKGGRNAPSDFYYYVMLIKGKDGIDYTPFSGFIYLYRTK